MRGRCSLGTVTPQPRCSAGAGRPPRFRKLELIAVTVTVNRTDDVWKQALRKALHNWESCGSNFTNARRKALDISSCTACLMPPKETCDTC